METKLRSKLIEAIEYRDETRRLKVYMTNGQRREYDCVPKGVVAGLTRAQSPGRFYMMEIRGRYPSL